MKRAQDGFAGNFGLVGKRVRHYLATTALTATGLLAAVSPASADNWTDHVASEGSISIDTSIPNTTNIKQHTDFVKVSGDGDINAGWTVNVAQNSSSSKYVLYDIENDPTMIMGNLNANGKVYIFDKNGVIFGKDSQVNVGSIVASTGSISDNNIKNDKISFEGINKTDGEIAINGAISVSDAGLAAFVAPTVANNGVISAKLGKVVMASGEQVTLDFYGDNLVNVAVKGSLENALVKNSGTVKAEGGSVYMTAAAAKEAVDNVINMDGVIDVSSVSVKGGKIILSGGDQGTVKVSGTLDASGKNGGGTVKVTGQNVAVESTGKILANATDKGNGGTVDVIAKDVATFHGNIYARGGALGGNGGEVEVSGYEGLDYQGLADLRAPNGELGNLLLDPRFTIIYSGSLPVGTFQQYVISSAKLASQLALGNVTLQADEFIDVGTKKGSYSLDIGLGAFINNALNALLNGLPDGDINVSRHEGALVPGRLTLQSDTVNFNRGLTISRTNPIGLSVLANTVNLDAKIFDDTGVNRLIDSRITSNAKTVNVISDGVWLRQAIWLADDAGGGTIYVNDGNYVDNININKSVKMYSVNGREKTSITGYSAGGNDATVTVSNGVNDVVFGSVGHGFTVNAFSNSRSFLDTSAFLFAGNHTNIDVIGNRINANGDYGMLGRGILNDIVVQHNQFNGQTFDSKVAFGAGSSVPVSLVLLDNGGNVSTNFRFNEIFGTAGGTDINDVTKGAHLVHVAGDKSTVSTNFIRAKTAGEGKAAIYVTGSNIVASDNTISVLSELPVGIYMQNAGGKNNRMMQNKIFGTNVGTGLIAENIYSDSLWIRHNQIRDTDIGFHALGDGNFTTIEVTNNTFTNNDIGARFESGIIDLTKTDKTTKTGNTFIGGAIALQFDPGTSVVPPDQSEKRVAAAFYAPGGAPLQLLNSTLGTQTFIDQTQYYVDLKNGALFTPGVSDDLAVLDLDGRDSAYMINGSLFTPNSTGGVLTQEQFDWLEARFHHYPDGQTEEPIDNLGRFFFGSAPTPPVVPTPADELTDVNQNLIFNRFGAFNGDTTGLNVQITGLPSIPGAGAGTGPAALNNITTFAGGNTPSTPSSLNEIETAAGSDTATTQGLNAIETAAAGEQQSCWSNAVSAASAGQTVNVTYNGSFADNLNQAATCGGTF